MTDAGDSPVNPAGETCPICGKAAEARWRPFCSKRCADVDLHRWLSGGYVIPAAPDTDEEDSIGIQDERDPD